MKYSNKKSKLPSGDSGHRKPINMNNELPIGKKLDGERYTINNVLGRGGFSITYLAENRMGKKFTIKEFFIDKYCSREKNGEVDFGDLPAERKMDFKKRFEKEGRLLLKIEAEKHPNIVKPIELFSEYNTHYLVLEHIEGRTLKTVVDNGGPLKWNEASDWVLQIGSALSTMHQNKFYHLDIKPSNIIIDNNGQAVLIDFGLCKEVRHKHNNEFTTPAYSGGYSPPEQENGTGRPDARTDIYALAATCYFMLSGSKPGRVDQNDFSFIPHNNGHIIDALKKAMAIDPGERQQSVYGFLNDMQLDGGDETILKTAGRKTSPEKPRRLNPALLLAPAILMLLALAYFGNIPNINGVLGSMINIVPDREPDQEKNTDSLKTKPVNTPRPKEADKKPSPAPEPPSPKPKYANRYKGKIQNTMNDIQYHKIQLQYNVLNKKNEYGDSLIKGICTVTDKDNPDIYARYDISGFVNEENGTEKLNFKTASVIANRALDFCDFSGIFFYEGGTERIEAQFQHGTGTAQRNSCRPYRTNSKFILKKIK